MNKFSFSIESRIVSKNSPALIIAELSCNHIQNLDIAKQTIYQMAKSGADAVKFQTHTPDTITINCNNEYFTNPLKGTLWEGKTLYQLEEETYMPWEWTKELVDLVKSLGMLWFSSPFDITAVDFLETLNCPCYKIASPEITDIPLIKYAASKNKPIILSTGVADISDIELAIETCKSCGNNDIAVLQCISSYPALIEDTNLNAISEIMNKFHVLSGISDHSTHSHIPAYSVIIGGSIIEKHFILNKDIDSEDKEFSLTPEEFAVMVKNVREAELILGNKGSYKLQKKGQDAKILSRSIFVVEDIKKGEALTIKNIKSIRPSNGLHPKYFDTVLGKNALINIKRGTPLSLDLIN